MSKLGPIPYNPRYIRNSSVHKEDRIEELVKTGEKLVYAFVQVLIMHL